MLERIRLSQITRPLDVIAYWRDSGSMLLNPPYQRGDVWGTVRRRNLIRSLLLGIPIPSIIINDRFAAGWSEKEYISCAVIDGKQRMTAILMFLDSQLAIPGEWVGMDQNMIIFNELPIARQRGLRKQPIQFCEGQLGSIEEEMEVFELVNFGGVPQGESDSE